jgi:hypothetical protein
MPACAPLVIHILDPSSTYSSPQSEAVVLIAAASDPACGSVSAKLAGPRRPSAYGRSQRAFCAGVA